MMCLNANTGNPKFLTLPAVIVPGVKVSVSEVEEYIGLVQEKQQVTTTPGRHPLDPQQVFCPLHLHNLVRR